MNYFFHFKSNTSVTFGQTSCNTRLTTIDPSNRFSRRSRCLIPVRRLSRPARSMHFGDVSKTPWDHLTRNTLAARNNEA